MRSEREIHRAHDILKGIVTGEVRSSFREDSVAMHGIFAALDALCWVLQHDHNTAFADNLARIEADLAKQGYELKEVE